MKPLIKKPSLDANIYSNYRPVSNLSFVLKIIEKVVASRLRKHMKENNLEEEFQSAYKAMHSTETALLRVQNDILSALDDKKGLGVFLVLLDLSAAFDGIYHSILLTILKDILYIQGLVLNWFQSFLTGRSQQVLVNLVKSVLHILLYGVP